MGLKTVSDLRKTNKTTGGVLIIYEPFEILKINRLRPLPSNRV